MVSKLKLNMVNLIWWKLCSWKIIYIKCSVKIIPIYFYMNLTKQHARAWNMFPETECNMQCANIWIANLDTKTHSKKLTFNVLSVLFTWLWKFSEPLHSANTSNLPCPKNKGIVKSFAQSWILSMRKRTCFTVPTLTPPWSTRGSFSYSCT